MRRAPEEVVQSLGVFRHVGRKVRTSQGRVAVNGGFGRPKESATENRPLRSGAARVKR